MKPFSYTRAVDIPSAIAAVNADPASTFLAGGTTEIDLLRLGVARSEHLVDINTLPLTGIESLSDDGVQMGALARMNDVARDPLVIERFPAVSQALLLGASDQLRNMASMGGNLLQRVRCPYFRDAVSPCNKREPGSGCSAVGGLNRGHAVLGASDHCIATHPSDVAVALVAFDAVVGTSGPHGSAEIPIDDFFLRPGDTPHLEHPLHHGELIVSIYLPPSHAARRSLYVKFRDRQSYEFALVSVAAALDVADGVITDVRIALGGVATKPWRARLAENHLLGGPATPQAFAVAAEAELSSAVAHEYNAFKIPLARRAIVRALTQARDLR